MLGVINHRWPRDQTLCFSGGGGVDWVWRGGTLKFPPDDDDDDDDDDAFQTLDFLNFEGFMMNLPCSQSGTM